VQCKAACSARLHAHAWLMGLPAWLGCGMRSGRYISVTQISGASVRVAADDSPTNVSSSACKVALANAVHTYIHHKGGRSALRVYRYQQNYQPGSSADTGIRSAGRSWAALAESRAQYGARAAAPNIIQISGQMAVYPFEDLVQAPISYRDCIRYKCDARSRDGTIKDTRETCMDLASMHPMWCMLTAAAC
jgi:hypothetical protein